MKKLTLILSLAAALSASAGELIVGTVTVPSGSTNAAEDITLNLSASAEAPAVDAIVYSASGATTGTLAFAAADIGVARSLGDSATVLPGAGGAVYPVRTQVAAGQTNALPWRLRTLRVTVTQSNTNAAVYTVAVVTQ